MINYGYQSPILTLKSWGFGHLTKNVLNPQRDWTQWLPTYEPQFEVGFDTYGCPVWAWQNAVEIMHKFHFGTEPNYAERYNYNIVGIRPPGCDPEKVGQCIYDDGLIDNSLLPMAKTYEEFITPDPMPLDLKIKGEQWKTKYKFNYGTVVDGNVNYKERISDALLYSVVVAAVRAWILEDGVYVDKGLPPNHLCVIVKDTGRGFLVFDSYDHFIKEIPYSHSIVYAKGITLSLRSENYILDLFKRLLFLN